jgi:4-amino-4-deoxy-L-arabinose transferase-like glycosyltransferase
MHDTDIHDTDATDKIASVEDGSTGGHRPSPASILPAHPGDRLGWLTTGLLTVMTTWSAFRAFGPLSYPGDIWRQSDTASIARNFARNGMNLFYPQINWGGNGPGYVETELPLMPWLTAGLYRVFGEHEWLGRLVSLLFMLVAVWAFWGLARRLLAATHARWALIAFVASPVFMRWGTAFMPEATVMAFTLLALLFFCRWLQEDRQQWLLAAGAATSMAALVKPTSLHVGLVMALWLVIGHRERLRRPSVYLVGLAALVLPALWLLHASSFYRDYGNTFGIISGGDNKFGNLELWLSPAFYIGIARIEILFVYGAFGVLPALVGAYWLYRIRGSSPAGPLVLAGAIGIAVYYFAAGRYTSTDLGVQYHVFALPYAALATGVGVATIGRILPSRAPRPVVAAAAVLALALLAAESTYIWTRSFSDRSGVLGTCSQQLAQVSAPTDLVIVGTDSLTVDGAAANNYQEPVVFYQADRRGWVLAADQYDRTDLVTRFRDDGAAYFVNPFPTLLTSSSPLRAWLTDNAEQVRDSRTNGCDIWRLDG